MSYIEIHMDNTAASAGWVVQSVDEVYEELARRPRRPRGGWPMLCWLCGKGGSGMTELPDGRPVHRWPCWELAR